MALKMLVTSPCFMVDRGLSLSQGALAIGHQAGHLPDFPYWSRRPARTDEGTHT